MPKDLLHRGIYSTIAGFGMKGHRKDLHNSILNQKNQWCMELAKDEIILFLSTKIVKNKIDEPVLFFDEDLKI